MNRAIILMFFLAASALLPLTLPIIGMTLEDTTGEMPGLAAAYANSCVLAALTAFLATLLASYFLFVCRRLVECMLFAGFLFVLPGEFVALGTTRFLRFAFGFPTEGWRALALIWIEVGYVFPFIATALVGCYLAIGTSRLNAMHELAGNTLVLFRLIVRCYWSLFLLAWLLGFNLVMAESSRVTLLAVNAFGLGRVFFGNEVASGFAAKGVDVMLFIAAGVPVFPLLATLLFAYRQVSGRRWIVRKWPDGQVHN